MKRLLLFVLVTTMLVAARVNHHIYWNSTNPVFETFEGAIDSPGYYEIAAAPGDTMKFICPRRNPREFSVVYQVSQDDFAHCTISPGASRVGTCDERQKYFTIPLQKRDNDASSYIYFSTTSTGTAAGMDSKRMGLCLEKNMRLSVSLGLTETYPLEEVFNQLNLESKGLVDSNIYLTEEGSELHWKKNVFPAIEDKLNEMIRKNTRFDKNREMEPVPISNEFILEKLEEMQTPEEHYIYPRHRFTLEEEELPKGVGVISSIFLLVLIFLVILL